MTDFGRKCPGSDFRNLTSKKINCPLCDHENEMFSDENMIRCEKCKTRIKRFGENVASCIEWCEYAEKCFGKVLYKQWKEGKKKQN